ncbi:hypothetical protein FJZ31_21575 [Candidatus Poribacteria bacterium]|nr:hypothetical protein [Candidatus Poribacteria bacterium]
MKKTTEPLESLSEIELKKFIAARISGLISDVARDTRTRYKPETLLIRTYQTTSDEDFKARFRRVIAELLCDEWYEISNDGKGEIKGEYLSRLLYLVERVQIREAQPAVSSMAFNFKKFAGVRGYYTPDLAVQVLAALAPLQDKDSFYADFWMSILKDTRWRRYGGAAFTGLRFYGFQESLRGLPLYIKAGMEYPEDINLDVGVMRFVKQNRDRAVLSAIVDRFAKEPEDVRKRLLDALKDIPSIAEEVAKIEPRLTQTWVEKGSGKLFRNGLRQFRCVPAVELIFSEGTVKEKRKSKEKVEFDKSPRAFPDSWKQAAKSREQRLAA